MSARVVDLKLLAIAEVRVTILADGVVAKVESCPGCSLPLIVVRGPGHHDESFSCEECGTIVGATAKGDRT